jgi:hypothetical protein
MGIWWSPQSVSTPELTRRRPGWGAIGEWICIGRKITVWTQLENGGTYIRQWPLRELTLFAGQLRQDDEMVVEATGNSGCSTPRSSNT